MTDDYSILQNFPWTLEYDLKYSDSHNLGRCFSEWTQDSQVVFFYSVSAPLSDTYDSFVLRSHFKVKLTKWLYVKISPEKWEKNKKIDKMFFLSCTVPNFDK